MRSCRRHATLSSSFTAHASSLLATSTSTATFTSASSAACSAFPPAIASDSTCEITIYTCKSMHCPPLPGMRQPQARALGRRAVSASASCCWHHSAAVMSVTLKP